MDLGERRPKALTRLDDLKHRAKQSGHCFEANLLRKLEDNSPFQDSQRTKEPLPKDFSRNRAGDLSRHAYFAMPHDFSEVESHDIPAVRQSILRRGRKGDDFIVDQPEDFRLNSTATDALHPLIKDACVHFLRKRRFRTATLAAGLSALSF